MRSGQMVGLQTVLFSQHYYFVEIRNLKTPIRIRDFLAMSPGLHKPKWGEWTKLCSLTKVSWVLGDAEAQAVLPTSSAQMYVR